MEWIKLYIRGSLRGSIRFQLSPAERGVWYDLLLLAGDSRLPGLIQAAPNIPYPLTYLARILSIPDSLLKETIAKCQEDGRLKSDGQGIKITNWEVYQSEYQRQKEKRIKAGLKAKGIKPTE